MAAAKEQADLMKQPEWYTKAQEYWNGVTPSIDGMLGGFAVVDPIDVKGSLAFLKEFVEGPSPMISKEYACDCGAGIGRVTKKFLLQVPFAKVDLVEQAPSFCQQAKDEYLKQEIEKGQIGRVICQGLQEFEPKKNTYSLIWAQWVLSHLSNDDFVSFLKRCVKGLKPNGMIGIKENNAKVEAIVDDEDSSITRTNAELKQLFEAAGLTVIKEEVQKGLPAGLFAVRMYMLKQI